jgi:resuscitation-promoting factor RpfB
VAVSGGAVYAIGHYHNRGRIDPVADVVAQIPVSRPAARLERERQHMIQMASASRTMSLVGTPKLATRPQAPATVATPGAPAAPGTPTSATPPPVPSAPAPNPGTAQSIGYNMLSSFGWNPSSEFSCLDNIWTRESGWRWNAENASGAYGIPQALPGSKMASAGADWQTNPATQIKWGLGYIQGRYGSPCAAWGFWQNNGWY